MCTHQLKTRMVRELELVFYQFSRYSMKILLGDFNAKIGREDIFKLTIWIESLHEFCNENVVKLVYFATSKNLIFKTTTFPHLDTHKHTWTFPDGSIHNQIDHVLIDRRKQSNIVEVERTVILTMIYDLVIEELRARLLVRKQAGRFTGLRYSTLKDRAM